MTLVEQSATYNANLKCRLARGPEYREDKTPDGIEIWPTLTRSEIAEVMAEAAVRIDILEAEAQCDEEYQELIKARVRTLEAELEKARDAALEEAAKVAECHFDERGNGRSGHHSEMDWTDGYRDATRGAAAAIRSLSHKEG